MCAHFTHGGGGVNLLPMGNLAEDIRRFCGKHRLRLNPDLGQHFLVDEDALRVIVEAAAIAPMDHVLEIGAGIGILTKELLARAGHVTAIELDPKLIPLLREYVSRCHGERRRTMTPPSSLVSARDDTPLTIIQGNALEIPLPETPYKIVANIPYHITSPLLRHAFLESGTPPKTMTLLLQREVAEKIVDTEDHGLLTILVGLFGLPKLVRTVAPEAFLPPPKVDSAVLHIDCFPHPRAERETIEEIFRLTKLAFSQKRKMLRNTLGSLPGGMERLAQAGIDAMRRPQTLSVEEWIALAKM